MLHYPRCESYRGSSLLYFLRYRALWVVYCYVFHVVGATGAVDCYVLHVVRAMGAVGHCILYVVIAKGESVFTFSTL